MSGVSGEVIEFDWEHHILFEHEAKGYVAGCPSGGDSVGPEYCWEVVDPHFLGLAGTGGQFQEDVCDWAVAMFYHSICCGMVGCYGDLSDIVTLQEEVGPLLVLCSSIDDDAFWHSISADNILVGEVSDLFGGSIQQGSCFHPSAEVFASDDEQVMAIVGPGQVRDV